VKGGKPRVHLECPCVENPDYHYKPKQRPHGLCQMSMDFPIVTTEPARVTCKLCTKLISEKQP
jgi:hypothetical protein